jgi:hypothetical protein
MAAASRRVRQRERRRANAHLFGGVETSPFHRPRGQPRCAAGAVRGATVFALVAEIILPSPPSPPQAQTDGNRNACNQVAWQLVEDAIFI